MLRKAPCHPATMQTAASSCADRAIHITVCNRALKRLPCAIPFFICSPTARLPMQPKIAFCPPRRRSVQDLLPSALKPLTLYLLLLVLLPMALIACSDTASQPAAQTPSLRNLLDAPGFEGENGRLDRSWTFIHHANTDSFTLTLQDGEALLRRIGKEPWSRLTQSVSGPELEARAGSWMAFSAELMAELDSRPWAPLVGSSGFIVQVVRQPPEDFRARLMGQRNIEEHLLEIEPDVQIPEWQEHVLEFYVPEDVQRIDVSIIMASGGWFKFRNPVLRQAEEQ